MIVKCIQCQEEWKKSTPKQWGRDDITSSLCDKCFREIAGPIIHKHQLEEGKFDCFGKARDYCDQDCKYKRWCVHENKNKQAQTAQMNP